MYVINNAKTGITEIDAGIQDYLGYLAHFNFLPNGTYALAGGCIRSLLDKTRVRDLDIYVLGTKKEHDAALNDLSNRGIGYIAGIQTFCNPFAHFRLLNIPVEDAFKVSRGKKIIPKSVEDDEDAYFAPPEIEEWPPRAQNAFTAPVQFISFLYDSKYYERLPADVRAEERYADTPVSSLTEVVNSFDLTISKGGIEFIVTDREIIVSKISIPHDCLIDICLKKLTLATDDGVVPQQLCTIRRFHKLIKLGYDTNDQFYNAWNTRFKHNPHVLELSYE